MKKVIKRFEFETCPKCGSQAEWTESEVDTESYEDSYCCRECETKYSIIFDMSYKYHYIEDTESCVS